MHGQTKRRAKVSEYGTQLMEKQKAKYTYGILERQFRNIFLKAARKGGITGEVLLNSLNHVSTMWFTAWVFPQHAMAPVS